MIYQAEGARIIGEVSFGEDCSIWYNAVIRGDSGSISFGNRVNIQDNVTVHTGKGYTVEVKDDVTIGHNAIVHGCQIGSGTLIGMGAILMNGSSVGSHCIVAAGALLPENHHYEDGTLIMGMPAKAVRKLTEQEIEENIHSAKLYAELARRELSEK